MGDPKVIVITGVTYGIGYELAKWYLNNGHTVIGNGRSKEKLDHLSSSFKSKKCSFTVVDVSDSTAVEAWAKQSITCYGSPDLLINNAAVANKPNNLWDVSLEEFDKLIDINVKGTNYVIHSFVPSMIATGKGVIINLSSGWGRCTAPQTAPYCCSKWGIEGLSHALSQELPQPLACAAMNPGMINTEMLVNYYGEESKYSQSPIEWAEKAGPYLLKLDRRCNGKQLTAP